MPWRYELGGAAEAGGRTFRGRGMRGAQICESQSGLPGGSRRRRGRCRTKTLGRQSSRAYTVDAGSVAGIAREQLFFMGCHICPNVVLECDCTKSGKPKFTLPRERCQPFLWRSTSRSAAMETHPTAIDYNDEAKVHLVIEFEG